MIRKILFLLAISLSAIAHESPIGVPAEVTEEATSSEGALVEYSITAADGTEVSCSPASGSVMPIGETTITCETLVTETVSFPVFVTATGAPEFGLPVQLIAKDIVDGDITATCETISETQARCTATNTLGKSTSVLITITPDTPVSEAASIDLRWDAPTTRENGDPMSEAEIAGYKINVLNTDKNNLTTYSTPTNATVYTTPGLVSGPYEITVRAEDVWGLTSDPSDILRVVI